MTRCWVISWFVYSQCATRGYSLLSTRPALGLSLGCCPAPPQPWCSGPGCCCQASILTFCVSPHACAEAWSTSLCGVRSGRVGPGYPLPRSHYIGPCLLLAWVDTDTLRRIRATGRQKTLPLTTLGHNLHSTGRGGLRRQSPDVGRALRLGPWHPGPLSSALAAVTGHVSRERVKT